MTAFRKVLLADPVMVSHSLLYYEAALSSAGFEETHFTIAAATLNEADQSRAMEFCASRKNSTLRLLNVDPGPCGGRLECWRGFGRSMHAIERLLQNESFDLLAYVSLDHLLLNFARPGFPGRFPAHARIGTSGTLFRDNGLRPPVSQNIKGRLRNWMDFVILRRALANPALRQAAFLDHWCADRARQVFNSQKPAYGVDPVFALPCDPAAARAQFGLKRDDFAVLLFGVLSDRKGIVESLAMLRAAPLPADKTVIIVAGPAVPQISERLQAELDQMKRQYRVVRHDRFLQQSEMPLYFAAADCVVCIYRDFSGSSSVLLHSAIYGKPAVVSPGGAMEDAVRRYQFGEVAGIDAPAEGAKAIARIAALTASEREALARRARTYAEIMDAHRYMSQFV